MIGDGLRSLYVMVAGVLLALCAANLVAYFHFDDEWTVTNPKGEKRIIRIDEDVSDTAHDLGKGPVSLTCRRRAKRTFTS